MKLQSIHRHSPQSWSTWIDRRLRVAVPPAAVPWKVGQRVYWLINSSRPGSVVVSDRPRGALRGGRYFSTVVQRARLRRQTRSGARRDKSRTYLSVKGMLVPTTDRRLSFDEMKP